MDYLLSWNCKHIVSGRVIKALENTHSKAHVLFASTTHEMREGDYYASKRDGQNLFKQWVYKKQLKIYSHGNAKYFWTLRQTIF